MYSIFSTNMIPAGTAIVRLIKVNMKSVVSACRYCPKIKYDFTCGKELTLVS
jgi:hypothetical protein